jgi:lantibiotic biosynthesis protein
MSEQALQNDFAPSGFFALRTPLLPFDELLAWSAGLEAPLAIGDPARLEEALASDRTRLRSRLQAVVFRPEVREGLFVASPDLDDSFERWIREPESERGQKVERALVRYFTRMAGRATPFGLFAGCSVATLGPETRLLIEGRAHYRRHTRLDMDYLVSLTDALGRDVALRNSLTYFPNTSLYPSNGRMRYAEVRRAAKGWSHHAVAIERSDYLEATLARTSRGARPPALIGSLLEQDPDASPAEAEDYIGELIENQILRSELSPAVTGPEPIDGMVTKLREGSAADVANRLEQIRSGLAAIDSAGVGVAPVEFRRIARSLEDLPVKVELNRLFQVDMVKPASRASLGPAVVGEILRGVQILQRLTRRPSEDRLARFREAFVARYEGREVPLVEALDEDIGVGFDTLNGGTTDASALLDGLTFPKTTEETVPWGKRETLLLGKLAEALARGSEEIVLEPRDLEEMAFPDLMPLPDAFAVMATLAARSEPALASGDFRLLLNGACGPSGGRLLGRFCHADPELSQHVEQHLRAEEALQLDAVFAEIVHLPEGRLGNILSRPILRTYEIPYLGHTAMPPDRQIPVTDLLVSVVGEQIVLRSARLGRRVIPRLTSAHNFHSSQGIYRFLCAIQEQGLAANLGWDWGALKDVPFLPRVIMGRIILSRASWHVSQQELRSLGHVQGPDRFRAAQAWRSERRLPRWIALADADNELPIDLDNVLSIETFIDLAKGRPEARLVEMFPGPEDLCACGPEGRFVHELVVPFVRKPDAAAPRDRAATGDMGRPKEAPLCRRSFPPGSEWLYVKLYTGTVTADKILRDVVQPVTERALRSGAADRWFFIRYGDPDWHVRVRFHGAPQKLQGEVLPALQAVVAPFLKDGRLWRVQLDTYEREVERYGGPEGIILAERIFHADSEAALAVLALDAEDPRGDSRWRLALCGMEMLLQDLGLELHSKRAIIRQARDRFGKEFRVDANLKHQLGDKYRRERRSLEAVLNPVHQPDGPLGAGLEILRQRSERLAPVMAELKACARAGALALSVEELALSYLHMHGNRLLRSAQTAQELVLYDFLSRLYQSEAARAPELR